MSLLMFLVLIASGFPAVEKDPSISSIRLKFHNSTSSEKICKDLIKQLEPYNEKNNALLLGYKGSATMVMAKHVINPFSKFSYFKKGKNMLERSIQADGKNVELRFLRYAIQSNVPSLLGYSSDLEKDKVFLKQSVESVRDPDLKNIIISYLKQNK